MPREYIPIPLGFSFFLQKNNSRKNCIFDGHETSPRDILNKHLPILLHDSCGLLKIHNKIYPYNIQDQFVYIYKISQVDNIFGYEYMRLFLYSRCEFQSNSHADLLIDNNDFLSKVNRTDLKIAIEPHTESHLYSIKNKTIATAKKIEEENESIQYILNFEDCIVEDCIAFAFDKVIIFIPRFPPKVENAYIKIIRSAKKNTSNILFKINNKDIMKQNINTGNGGMKPLNTSSKKYIHNSDLFF